VKTRIVKTYMGSPYFSDRLMVQMEQRGCEGWEQYEHFNVNEVGKAVDYAKHLSLDLPEEPGVMFEFDNGVQR
jgi:hypothetical protein